MVSRLEMLEAMAEDEEREVELLTQIPLPPQETVEQCERCKKNVTVHTLDDGWYYCPTGTDKVELIDRSPNLGWKAKEVQKNLERMRRDDRADRSAGNRYPRRTPGIS